MVERTGFLGGGQMATALAKGAVAADFLQSEELVFAEPNSERQHFLKSHFAGAELVLTPEELLGRCSRIVLAVKPHVLKAISAEVARHATDQHLFISIAAGIALEKLQSLLGVVRVIRVMPNTPCQVAAGASAVSADDSIAEEDLNWVTQLMQSVGIVERVDDDLIHAVTGIAGSSPAYIYMIIEALSDGGVAEGLSRPAALRLAAQTVMGAAKMVLDTGQHPGQLKDQVTSPGGTTIAAVRSLEAAGVRSGLIDAVIAASQRSREMG